MERQNLWGFSPILGASSANLGVSDASSMWVCRRPGCENPVSAPDVRGGYSHIYCSTKCRKAVWEANHPRVPIQNSDKRSRSQKVLARLREGSATALELQMAGGGTAATSRVRELRSRGYVIECERSGEHPRYVLVSEPRGE